MKLTVNIMISKVSFLSVLISVHGGEICHLPAAAVEEHSDSFSTGELRTLFILSGRRRLQIVDALLVDNLSGLFTRH